jgi:hypothetical protein
MISSGTTAGVSCANAQTVSVKIAGDIPLVATKTVRLPAPATATGGGTRGDLAFETGTGATPALPALLPVLFDGEFARRFVEVFVLTVDISVRVGLLKITLKED